MYFSKGESIKRGQEYETSHATIDPTTNIKGAFYGGPTKEQEGAAAPPLTGKTIADYLISIFNI
ncbi:unnamed protein product [Prunus armeniaca]